MIALFVMDSDYKHLECKKAIDSLPMDGSKVVTITNVTRTLAQNAVQWPILNAFAQQLMWPVNGVMCKLSAEEWKDLLTAAYRQEVTRVALGLDGGMVMLGQKTKGFSQKEWSDWMEFINSVAVDRGIKIPMSKSEWERIGNE